MSSLLFSLLATQAVAVAPGSDWLTLKTPNFRVHHSKAQTAFARTFASHLERHLPALTRDLGWTPPTPIDIVVNDRSDLSNGLAQNFPTNRMEVQPVPFESESTLMDYHDWVEELAVHELTHLIANDGATGFFRTLKSVFGTAIRPNGLQPGWLIEGLAVFEETRLTPGGRGRSVFTEALLRTATAYRKLESDSYLSLDKFNDGVFWWPAGHTRYLLGYSIQASLERRRGQIRKIPKHGYKEQSVPGLVSIGAARNFPYALDGNLERITGATWMDAWNETQKLFAARYLDDEKADPRAPEGIRGECRLTKSGRFTGGQVVGKDGMIYFSFDHPAAGRGIARMPLNSPCLSSERVAAHSPADEAANFEILKGDLKRSTGMKLALSPDGKFLAYSELGYGKGGREIFDLHLLDLKSRKTKQLTRERRARDPFFSEDGKELFFVSLTDDGFTRLEAVTLATGSMRELFRGGRFQRLGNPFVRGGRVYFSRHDNRGREEILVIAASGGSAARAIPDFGKGKMFAERNPYVLPDGTIYFTATYHAFRPDFGGARHEVYAWKPGAPRPALLTRTLSGLSLGPIPLAQHQVLVANYGLEGFDLTRVAIRGSEPKYADKKTERGAGNSDSLSLAAAANETPGANLHEFLTNIPSSFASLADEGESAENADAKRFPPSVDYRTLSTPATSLWPQYWLPLYLSVPEGGLFGATTSGVDPLQHNRYTLLAMADTRASFPTYMASYTNTANPLALNLVAMQNNNYFSGSNSNNRQNYYAGQFGYSLFGIRAGLGGGFQQRRLGSISRDNPLAFARLAFGGLGQSTALPIAPNRGIQADTYGAFFPESKGEVKFWELRARAAAAFPGLFGSHSSGLSASFGASTNRTLASNYYQGGGPVNGIDGHGAYVVRGYPEDSLFGQRILAANASYTLPLARLYKGWGIGPMFVSTLGLRLLADAGSAIYMARYNGNTFRGYQAFRLGKQFIYGSGAEFLVNSTIAYYAPVEIAVGIHHGFDDKFGGETRGFFGINIGFLGIY